MPINFGLLSPIAPESATNRVIGQGTSTTTNLGSGGDTLGSGISKGVENFQSGRLNTQSIEANQMKLDAAKHGAQVEGEIEASYKKDGYQGALETMRQNGMFQQAEESAQRQQALRNSILDGETKVVDLSAKQLALATEKMKVIGTSVSVISSFKTPEEQQQAYQKLKPGLEKRLGEALPDQYDPLIGLEAMHTIVDLNKQIEKNPYIMEKLAPTKQGKEEMHKQIQDQQVKPGANTPPIEDINNYLNALNARRDELVKAGSDTSSIDADIKRAQDAAPGKAGFWDSLKASAGTEAGKILGAVVPKQNKSAPIDDLEQQAKDAIAKGADPKAVQARLEQLRNGK